MVADHSKPSNSGKAVVQYAAVKISVNNLPHIGPEEVMLPCKALSPHTGYQGGSMKATPASLTLH